MERPCWLPSPNFLSALPLSPTVVASSTKQDNKSHEERNKFTSLTSKKESSNEVCIEGGKSKTGSLPAGGALKTKSMVALCCEDESREKMLISSLRITTQQSPRGNPTSLAKCFLSVSTTWCGFRHSFLSCWNSEILTIMIKWNV